MSKNIIVFYLEYIFNKCIEEGVFPTSFKTTEVVPIINQELRQTVRTTDQFLSDHLSQNYLKAIYTQNWINISLRTIQYTNDNTDFKRTFQQKLGFPVTVI